MDIENGTYEIHKSFLNKQVFLAQFDSAEAADVGRSAIITQASSGRPSKTESKAPEILTIKSNTTQAGERQELDDVYVVLYEDGNDSNTRILSAMPVTGMYVMREQSQVEIRKQTPEEVEAAFARSQQRRAPKIRLRKQAEDDILLQEGGAAKVGLTEDTDEFLSYREEAELTNKRKREAGSSRIKGGKWSSDGPDEGLEGLEGEAGMTMRDDEEAEMFAGDEDIDESGRQADVQWEFDDDDNGDDAADAANVEMENEGKFAVDSDASDDEATPATGAAAAAATVVDEEGEAALTSSAAIALAVAQAEGTEPNAKRQKAYGSDVLSQQEVITFFRARAGRVLKRDLKEFRQRGVKAHGDAFRQLLKRHVLDLASQSEDGAAYVLKKKFMGIE